MRIIPDRRNRRTLARMRSQPSDFRSGLRSAFFKIGADFLRKIQQRIIKGPKAGKFYRVKGRKRRHRASAPGEAPANLTGRLQRTSGFEIRGSDTLEIGYRAPYGGYLEDSTVHIAKRPNIQHVGETGEGIWRGYFDRHINSRVQRP